MIGIVLIIDNLSRLGMDKMMKIHEKLIMEKNKVDRVF
jgi:hypothetical protein